jgi:hypothetical protein
MIRYGVIFFLLEKLGAVGRRLQPAHLRRHARPVAGRLPEDPQHQGALYSVASTSTTGATDWNKPAAK